VVFYLSGARCSTYGPADAMVHPTTPPSFVSYKSILILPFWYLHTQVKMEKRPVNECSNSTVHSGSHAGDGTFHTPLSSPGLGRSEEYRSHQFHQSPPGLPHLYTTNADAPLAYFTLHTERVNDETDLVQDAVQTSCLLTYLLAYLYLPPYWSTQPRNPLGTPNRVTALLD